MVRQSLLLWLLTFAAAAGCAQSQDAGRAAGPPQPTLTFSLDFPQSQPEHYEIRVPSAGAARYESSGRLSADSDVTDRFEFDFTLSNETRAKMFSLAAKAGYFAKDLDSHHKNLAFTGKKTLRYSDANRSSESTYNYSSNAAAQELTTLFQNLSATLEFGHRLDYDRRYQKLALEEELERMQEMAKTNTLVEVAVIRPILEQIVADPAVINVSRARAQRLLSGGAH